MYCNATLEESLRRYQERTENGDRHPGHHDDDPSRLSDLEKDIMIGLYDPLDLDIPFVVVDTTERYDPNEDEIVRFIREHAG